MKLIFQVGLALALFSLNENFSLNGKNIRSKTLNEAPPVLNGNSSIKMAIENTRGPIIQLVDDDFATSQTFKNGFLFKIAMALFIVFVIFGIIASCCYELFRHGYIVIQRRDRPKTAKSNVSTISSVSSLIGTKTAIPSESTCAKDVVVNIDKQQNKLDQVTANYKAVPFDNPKLNVTAKFIPIKSPKPFVAKHQQSKLENLKLELKVPKKVDDKTAIKEISKVEQKSIIKSNIKSSMADQKSQVK